MQCVARQRSVTQHSRRRARGSATIELLLAAMLVLLPTVFAVLELGQLAVARHLLDLATFEAARDAALRASASRVDSRGSVEPPRIESVLARGLVPLFGAGVPRREGSDLRALRAYARARIEIARPDLTAIERSIRVDGPRPLLDPVVVDLQVRYCRQLLFPLTDWAISASRAFGSLSMFDRACLARRRVPIESRAVVLVP